MKTADVCPIVKEGCKANPVSGACSPHSLLIGGRGHNMPGHFQLFLVGDCSYHHLVQTSVSPSTVGFTLGSRCCSGFISNKLLLGSILSESVSANQRKCRNGEWLKDWNAKKDYVDNYCLPHEGTEYENRLQTTAGNTWELRNYLV